MRKLMRKLRVLMTGVALGATLAWTGLAGAVPLPLPVPGVPPTAGESDLFDVLGLGTDVTVDWMVAPIGGGVFAYMYQIENTSPVFIDLFTVTVPAGSVIAAGVLFGDDLDLLTGSHVAHIAANFPILAGPPAEEEGFLFTPLPIVTAVSATDVTWTWPAPGPLPPGAQSDTLFFTSMLPPTYGNAVVMDTSPPGPWSTLAGGSDPVPVPIPEPTSLLLLGSGLLGVALWPRYQSKRRRGEMSWKMRSLSLVIALAALLTLAGQAVAVPLPGTLSPPFPPVAGESDLTSFITGPASDVTVDWMVLGPDISGNFTYYFQVENTTTVALDGLTVTTVPGTVIAAGVLAGDDLDLLTVFHPAFAHTAVFFPILAGEEEGFVFPPAPPIAPVSATIAGDGSVTWTFSPLAVGQQSDTLFFISPNPPTYGNAVASDAIPPSPWGSLATGGDPVPVPFVGALVSEPGALFLLGSGLLAAAAWARRRSRREKETAMRKIRRKAWFSLGVVAFAISLAMGVPESFGVPIPSGSYYTGVIGGGIGAAPAGYSGNDDGSFGPYGLGFTLSYFGVDYTTFYINNNGNISFGSGVYTYTPSPLNTTSVAPMIAPYWADVDTRSGLGTVGLRTDIANQIIVTWDNVGYYSIHGDKRAFFQLVLRGPGYTVPSDEGDIGFFFKTVDWETGDASGGSGGFGGTEATVGFGDGLAAVNPGEYSLPGSQAPGISGIVENNHYWFNLGSGGTPTPVPEPASLALLGSGLIGLGAWARSRRRSSD